MDRVLRLRERELGRKLSHPDGSQQCTELQVAGTPRSKRAGKVTYFFFIMENYFKLLQKGTKWSDFLPDSQQDYCLCPHPGNSEAFPPDCSDQRCLGAAGRTRAELGKINTHPHPGCDSLPLLPSTHAMARLQPPGRTQKSHDRDIT